MERADDEPVPAPPRDEPKGSVRSVSRATLAKSASWKFVVKPSEGDYDPTGSTRLSAVPEREAEGTASDGDDSDAMVITARLYKLRDSDDVSEDGESSAAVPLRPGRTRRVLVLYTGGTFGMVKGPRGYEAAPIHSVFEAFPEARHPDLPGFDLIEMQPLIDSSDMRPEYWVRLAEIIEQRYFDYDGFVVLHGTDTMAYTASALSFLLENLAKPVVLTGAAVPLCEVHSDAMGNFFGSMMIAGMLSIPEVCLFFDNHLYRGNRCSKVNAWGPQPFFGGSLGPLVEVGTSIVVHQGRMLPQPRGRFKATLQMCVDVGVIRLVPGFSDSILRAASEAPIKGLVLQSYGAGNAPIYRKGMARAIRAAVDRGIVIVVVTQCTEGSVDFDKYAAGSILKEAGAVSGYNMTTEAAVTKLSYLLGKGYPPATVRDLMGEDLRGELTRSMRTARSDGVFSGPIELRKVFDMRI